MLVLFVITFDRSLVLVGDSTIGRIGDTTETAKIHVGQWETMKVVYTNEPNSGGAYAVVGNNTTLEASVCVSVRRCVCLATATGASVSPSVIPSNKAALIRRQPKGKQRLQQQQQQHHQQQQQQVADRAANTTGSGSLHH